MVSRNSNRPKESLTNLLLNRHHQHKQHPHKINDHYQPDAYQELQYGQPYWGNREGAGGGEGFRGQLPGSGFGVQQDGGFGRQHHGVYQDQRPGERSWGQSPYAYSQEQRRGPWVNPGFFQPRQEPSFQPPVPSHNPHNPHNPHNTEFKFPLSDRTLQPNPWAGSSDSAGGFQESGNGIRTGNPQNPSGKAGQHPGLTPTNPSGFQQPSNGWQFPNPSLQPRPQSNDQEIIGNPQDASESKFQGSGNTPTQVISPSLLQRPQANGPDSQLHPDSTLQPRPQSPATSGNPTSFNFQSSDNHGNSGQTGLQQPAVVQQSGSSIQPLPIASADNEPASGNPIKPGFGTQRIQPIPQSHGEVGLQKSNEEQGGITLRPTPATDSSIDDTISSIFNTHSYMSPNMTQQGKVQGSENPESIGERNLFETSPQCKDGMVVIGGRCRQKAR